jgi:hypothetical protein
MIRQDWGGSSAVVGLMLELGSPYCLSRVRSWNVQLPRWGGTAGAEDPEPTAMLLHIQINLFVFSL